MKILTNLLRIISPITKKAADFFKPLTAKFQNSKSIKTKLILAFIVPMVLIVLQGIFSFSRTSTTVEKLAEQSSITAMESSGKYLKVVMQTVDSLAAQIFANADLQDYLSNIYPDDIFQRTELSKKIQNYLLTVSTFSPDIYNISLIPYNDEVFSLATNTSQSVLLSDIENAEFITSLHEKTNSSAWYGIHKELDDVYSTNTDTYSMSLVRLIRSTMTMEDLGLLVIDLKPAVVTDLFAGINLSDNQQIHLISPDNRVISNGQEMSGTASLVNEKFFMPIAAKESDLGSQYIKYGGIRYLASYYKMPDTGYMLLGMMPKNELNSAATSLIYLTIVMIVVGVLIAFGTGITMANSMSRTINRIIHASGKAASGDLSVRFDSRRKDELGTLTRSINTMIGSMRSLIEQTMGVSVMVSESAVTVSSTAQQVSAVSQDISRSILEISQGASAQASDAEQGVEKIGVLAEKITNVSENAKSIDLLTSDTMQLTQNGLASVEDLDVKANKTTDISKEIMNDIKELNIHSKSIGKIVKVISNIADQTNLLALNATIEAARAGEMGKGFAVVADEVRKLAEQSMNATREIAAIIKNTQDKTEKAVEKAATTETILKSQNEAVLNTTGVFKQIMNSMEKLSLQVEQVMSRIAEMEITKEQTINSIQNISAVSQETAASSEEVTASTQEQLSCIEELSRHADELQNSAADLKQSIARFKLD